MRLALLLCALAACTYAEDAPVKASDAVLKADICHYIIQGAPPDEMTALPKGPRCLAWQSFATYEEHLAALRLYRAEIEKVWPPGRRRWDLIRDLKIIDAEKK